MARTRKDLRLNFYESARSSACRSVYSPIYFSVYKRIPDSISLDVYDYVSKPNHWVVRNVMTDYLTSNVKWTAIK